MAETSTSDEVRSSLPEAQPTPLTSFSERLLPAYVSAGQAETGFLRSAAARERSDAAAAETAMGKQSEERAVARPAPPALPTPPETTPRPFLTPGPSMMSQLQGVLTGVTQMVLGVGGLKGGGHAIAAVAGLKGAMEGWQQGDHERAAAALRDWKTNSEKLQADYENRLESYRTILTDQKMDMANRLALIGIRARVDGDEATALAAERGQIKDLIDIFGKRETHAQDYDLKAKELEKQTAQFAATAARQDRDFKALQERRGQLERHQQAVSARADDAAKFRKEISGGVMKLQTQDTSLGNKLRTADIVEEAVKVMADRKLLATGPTTPDAWRAAVRRQTAFNDPQVKWAMDTIERLGTGLVVGSEIALGEPASVMRIRAVVEPQAGHILTAGADFWKTFFDRYRPFLQEQRTMVRDHLAQIGRLPPDTAAAAEYQILGAGE